MSKMWATSLPFPSTDFSPPLELPPPPSQGPIARWIVARREEIVLQMTEACLNQTLDALLARSLLNHEDHELVVDRLTRTAKVRQLLDICHHRHSEDVCLVIVRKLQDNKQQGLQPYPPELSSPTATLTPSAPPMPTSYNITRNM